MQPFVARFLSLTFMCTSLRVAGSSDSLEFDDPAFLQVTEGAITKRASKSGESFFPKPEQPAQQQETVDSMEVSMAKMASDTYSGGWWDFSVDKNEFTETQQSEDDWYNCKWVKKFEQAQTSGIVGLGQDKIALFQSTCRECALVFSGGDDVKDMLSNLQVLETVPKCGVELHKGFYEKLVAQTQNETFQTKFKPYLDGSDCKQGTYAVGHAQGGALATIFAGCAMRSDAPESIKDMWVDGLYTFGAPSVSKPKAELGPDDHPTGQLTPDGESCFEGARFFNVDAVDYDPVPPTATALGFVHPKVAAVKFSDVPFKGIEKTEFECNGDEKDEPKPGVGFSLPNPFKNGINVYVKRTEKMYPGHAAN